MNKEDNLPTFLYLLQYREWLLGALPKWVDYEDGILSPCRDYDVEKWARAHVINSDGGSIFDKDKLLSHAAMLMDEDFIVFESWRSIQVFCEPGEAEKFAQTKKQNDGYRVIRIPCGLHLRSILSQYEQNIEM